MPTHIAASENEEFAPYYAAYIQFALNRGDVFAALSQPIEEMQNTLGSLTEQQALFRDAPGKWTIKEVMGHVNDVERVFAYRLLRISRNDQTPLPGFEQDDFVRESTFNTYPVAELLQEFEFLRRASVLAIRNLSPQALLRCGTASGFPFSVRALVYALVGHVDHHMASLHEKYLPFAVE